MLTCTILSQNSEELIRFFGDLSFQFQRPQRTGVDFLDTFFYPRVKCVFLLQAVRVFWKKAYVLNFISKWPIFLVIYPFNSNGQWSIFQPLPSYPWIKCVFPSSVCESFPKNADVDNFISKWRRALTRRPFFWWFILSISMPTMDRGRFSSHFLLSVDKMCFPSSVCESFLKKCWRGQFYLKMAKALTRFFWWFILSISMPTMDRGRFSRHFLLSEDKMCFPSSVLWEFSQKMLTWTILSQMAKALTRFFWWFSSHLSADKMSFSFQAAISKKCDVHNIISKWRRSGYFSFQFQRPQSGVDFPFYPWIKCVFPLPN